MTYATDDNRLWETIQSDLRSEKRWHSSAWNKEEILIDGVIHFNCGFIQDIQSNLTLLADKIRTIFYASIPSFIALTLASRVINNEVSHPLIHPLLAGALLIGAIGCYVLAIVAKVRLRQIRNESLLWKDDKSNIELIARIRKEVIIDDRMETLNSEPRLRYPPHFLFTTCEIKNLIKRLINNILLNPEKDPFKKLQQLNSWVYKGSYMLSRKPGNEMIRYSQDRQIEGAFFFPPDESKSSELNQALWIIADNMAILSGYPQSERFTKILTLLQQRVSEQTSFHQDDCVIAQEEHDKILDQIAIDFCTKLKEAAQQEEGLDEFSRPLYEQEGKMFVKEATSFFDQMTKISGNVEEDRIYLSPAEVFYLKSSLTKALEKRLDATVLASILDPLRN